MKNLKELREELKSLNTKKSNQKVGVNSYFLQVMKDGVRLTKEELIDEVTLVMYQDKFNEDLTIENFRKRKDEIIELQKTINNSIDTSKSNSHTKGYISGTIKNQRLLKEGDKYYLELI